MAAVSPHADGHSLDLRHTRQGWSDMLDQISAPGEMSTPFIWAAHPAGANVKAWTVTLVASEEQGPSQERLGSVPAPAARTAQLMGAGSQLHTAGSHVCCSEHQGPHVAQSQYSRMQCVFHLTNSMYAAAYTCNVPPNDAPLVSHCQVPIVWFVPHCSLPCYMQGH